MSESEAKSNPHRGDTTVRIGGQTYIMCYDLNALSKVMERMGIKSMGQAANIGTDFSEVSFDDFLYIIWFGFNRHHPDLTREDIGGMDWDLDEMGDVVSEAMAKAVSRKSPPEGAVSGNPPGPQTEKMT